MPSSRKKNRGKERKAKALVAEEKREANVRRKWLSWASPTNVQCSHSLQTIPAQDHTVSRFISTLWEPWDGQSTNSAIASFIPASLGKLEKSFSKYSDVWKDDDLRQVAITVLLSIGVNILLYRLEHPILIEMAATTIALLENCDGKSDFKSTMFADVSGGGERQATRFFAKRVACSCLKVKNAQLKKMQLKTGMCDGCYRVGRREGLMVCSRCKLVQFCSKVSKLPVSVVPICILLVFSF